MIPASDTTRRQFLATSAAAGLAAWAATSPATHARPADGPWQLGCYTRPWDQFEYRVAFDAIAEAGFPFIGLMTHKGKNWVMITPQTTPEEAANYGEEAKKRNLKVISIYGQYSVAESVENGVRDLRRLIERCAACGSPNLLLGGTTDPKQYEKYYKTVAECCDFAASKGVGLTVKPHGGQNSTGPQCRKIIELVSHKNFRLTYDPGNIFYYSDGKLDPVDDAATVDGLVAGMCVKDFKPPKEVLVTPGTGRVDFKAVFARLQKGGFTRGPLVVECLDKGDAAFVTAEAKKALRFLKDFVGLST
jgi:sugar phosphate isomerase/epimerase